MIYVMLVILGALMQLLLLTEFDTVIEDAKYSNLEGYS
jgi:hypothetical protein